MENNKNNVSSSFVNDNPINLAGRFHKIKNGEFLVCPNDVLFDDDPLNDYD